MENIDNYKLGLNDTFAFKCKMCGSCCRVHLQKPVVCALFPLGRAMAYEDPNKDFSSIIYVLNPTACGSRRTKYTVESWLKEFGIPADDEFFLEWNTILFYLIDQIKFLEEKKVSAEGMDVVWNGVTGHLYLDYDTGKDFMEQFRENVRVLRETFSKLRILVENAE